MPTGLSPEAMQEVKDCGRSKTHVGWANCVNAVVAKNGQTGDLQNVAAAARVAYAEKVDKGQMSVADANLELAKIGAGLQSEQNRRTDAAWAAVQSSLPTTCNSSGSYGYVTTTCY
jgi:hypothetical protein